MDRRKCCMKCGKQFEESNSIDTHNKIITYNIEKEFQEDSIESNISVTTRSDNQADSNTDSGLDLILEGAGNNYGKIKVANSQNVIVGNVTYITGTVHITQITTHVEEENITNQLFLNDSELEKINLNIISRDKWMAQPTKQITSLPETAQYVIIAHTATEDGYTQPQNALLVKLIQTFHIESHNWDDIAYNFLVGCDGNVYEGRGWNKQGAHTYGYNKKSIGIAFIGCFMDHLPPVSALKAARKLIIDGVKLGFIPEDYTLVGHCQCSPIESPGVQLFNVIKRWPQWRELTPEDSK